MSVLPLLTARAVQPPIPDKRGRLLWWLTWRDHKSTHGESLWATRQELMLKYADTHNVLFLQRDEDYWPHCDGEEMLPVEEVDP